METNLEIRVKEIRNCIYCNEKLTGKGLEHIFNSCWGGKHETGQIICKICNGHFSAIDGSFYNFTKYIMNAWEFKGQRHNTIPTFKTTDGTIIESGGKPKKESKIYIEKRDDELLKIRINASSKTEVKKLFLSHLDEIEEKKGRKLTSEERENILNQIYQSNTVSEYVGLLEMEEMIRPIDMYRSTVHTLIKCLAMYEPEIIFSGLLQAAKDFAYNGTGEWTKYAIQEANPTFISLLDQMLLKEDVRFNAAEIYFSKAQGNIIGNLRILGLINIWVVLADTYVGPDKILSVVEKVNGSGKLDGRRLNVPIENMWPLILTDFAAPTEKQLFEKLSAVAYKSLSSMDILFHHMDRDIKKVTDKYPTVQNNSIKAIEEIYLKYLRDISNNQGMELDIENTRNLLWKKGLKEISETYSEHTFSNEVVNAFSKLLGVILKEILEKANTVEPQ